MLYLYVVALQNNYSLRLNDVGDGRIKNYCGLVQLWDVLQFLERIA